MSGRYSDTHKVVMARSSVSPAVAVVLLALTLTICRAEDTCAAYGQCCGRNNEQCGPPSCKCDTGCEFDNNCCPDYDDYCGKCDFGYRLGDICLRTYAWGGYSYARSKCRTWGRKGSVIMPRTEKQWTRFVGSHFYKKIVNGREYWLNCRILNNNWYWQVPGSTFPGKAVSWNKFAEEPPYEKQARYIGVGRDANLPWTKSKRKGSDGYPVDKFIICQKQAESNSSE